MTCFSPIGIADESKHVNTNLLTKKMKSYIKLQQPISIFKHSLLSGMYTTLPIFRPNLKSIGSLQLSTCHCTRNLFLQQHTSQIHHK